MKKQVTLIVSFEAKIDARDTVRRRIRALAESTRREEGNLQYQVVELEDEPGSFMIFENWRDQKALDTHMSQDYLKQFLADSEKLLVNGIRGKKCEILYK